MWLFAGRVIGNLTNSGISANFSRPPALKIPLESKNRLSLKSALDFLMVQFSLGVNFWVAEVRTLISSLKWIDCTALIMIISGCWIATTVMDWLTSLVNLPRACYLRNTSCFNNPRCQFLKTGGFPRLNSFLEFLYVQ